MSTGDRWTDESSVIAARDVTLTLETVNGPLQVMDNITLQVEPGQFVAVVGPSGCGKTMFLNAVAGLERYSGGSLLVNGKAPKAGERGVAYAFARDALLPWRNALRNVELALEAQGVPRAERRKRATEALIRVGLGDFTSAYRGQLSQGMRQRVSLARTLVGNPDLILLDEPFAALDAQTKITMQQHLLSVLRDTDSTVFLVTHDLEEAIVLADKVILFSRRPARVKHEFVIDLPRPRSASELRADPRFHELFTEIWRELAAEFSAS